MSQKTATLVIKNEVQIQILGLHGDHSSQLYDHFGYFAPNYFFSPKYKLGRWDGKNRYFWKTGVTYIYFLEEILHYLSRHGYTVEIEDYRTQQQVFPDLIDENYLINYNHLESGEPLELRIHQVEAVNALIKNGGGICIAGTGAGKTLAMTALLKAYDKYDLKSITIVPNQGLIRQTKREYINCELDTGEYSGDEKSIDHKHIVSTWQALQHNPEIMRLFQIVIVDECHGLKGPVLKDLLIAHGTQLPHRFGFTGTLPKDKSEQVDVHISVGHVLYEIPARELIDRGVLSTIQIHILQLEENLQREYEDYKQEYANGPKVNYKQFKLEYFPDFESEKAFLHRNTARIEYITTKINTLREQKLGNVLCLVDSIEFGRKLQKLVPNSYFVNGQDMKSENKREEVYKLFETHDDLVVFATVHIVGVGLNINRIFHLVYIDIGKSFIRIIQGIGRGLRKGRDKSHLNAWDICSDLKYAKKHLATRISYYKEAGYPHTKKPIEYNIANLEEI